MTNMKVKLRLEGIINKKELFYVLNNKKYFNFNAIVPEPKTPNKGIDKFKWRADNWGAPAVAKNTKIESDDVISFDLIGYPNKLFEKLSDKYPGKEVVVTAYINAGGNCKPITKKYLNGVEI